VCVTSAAEEEEETQLYAKRQKTKDEKVPSNPSFSLLFCLLSLSLSLRHPMENFLMGTRHRGRLRALLRKQTAKLTMERGTLEVEIPNGDLPHVSARLFPFETTSSPESFLSFSQARPHASHVRLKSPGETEIDPRLLLQVG
jgi:hypothetical protein